MRTTLTLVTIALLGGATSGCFVTTGGGGAQPAATPAAAEASARATWGDQLVNDLLGADAARQRREIGGAQVFSCIETYVRGLKAEKAGDLRNAAHHFRACRATAASRLPAATGPQLAAVAARYGEQCAARGGRLDAAEHLRRFRGALAEVDAATGALNRHYAMARARGALRQAREGLGADAATALAEDERLLAAAEGRYQAELARAHAFVTSPEVVSLERRRERLKAAIADAQRLGMVRSAELAKADLRSVEAKYSFLIQQHGL